jgi:hypothetical protein
MLSTPLIPKHASANRPSRQWNDDDFDLLANSEVVGRIFKANAAPVGSPWIWTLAFGHHEDARSRTATLQRARLPWLHSPRAGGASDLSGYDELQRAKDAALTFHQPGALHRARSGGASTHLLRLNAERL